MMTGLVLEGGAMRGMYTAGVLDTFLDENITVDCGIGVSAGALFGVNYFSGQKGRVIRYNKIFNQNPDYLGLRPLFREGNIVSTQFAYYDVPHHMDPFDDEAYRACGIPFYAVVTRLADGRPEYVQIRSVFDQMDTLRASGSMPFVSRPVLIDGQHYLDGGVSDSIPFEYLLTKGCTRLIVILTRDMSYRKKPMSKRMINLWYHRYPEFASQLIHRHDVYNQSVERLHDLELQGKAFIIRPSAPIRIGKIEKDPKKLQAVYDLGLRDAQKYLSDLKAWRKVFYSLTS